MRPKRPSIGLEGVGKGGGNAVQYSIQETHYSAPVWEEGQNDGQLEEENDKGTSSFRPPG